MAELLAAFLRGVNVNGNQIRMAALKEAFVGMGFTDVRTVLGTGNVVFTADPSAGEPKPRIEHALYAAFGYDAPVYLRTAAELVRLREHARAIAVPEGCHLYLLLCGDAALPAELAVLFAAFHGGTEEFYPAGADAFWVVPKGETLTSPFGSKALGAKLYRARLTSRNWRTGRKGAGANGGTCLTETGSRGQTPGWPDGRAAKCSVSIDLRRRLPYNRDSAF